MPPRHFWWLAESLQEPAKRKGLDADERAQMLRLIDDANKGKL